MNQFKNIPQELKNIPNWVCWQSIPDPKAHSGVKKVPINPHTGGQAQSNNPQTWADFDTALGASAHCAAHMSQSGCLATSRQREAPPPGKSFGSLIDGMLQLRHVVGGDDARRLAGRLSGKLGTNDEEATLDANEAFSVRRVFDVGQQEADLGIQFVDSAIALQSCTLLRHALAAHEGRHAGIAGLSINLAHLRL